MSTILLDRPLIGDPILLHAIARRGRPLSVTEFARAMAGTGARLSDVMELVSSATAQGLLHGRFRTDREGRPTGAMLYALTESGWAAVLDDRLAA